MLIVVYFLHVVALVLSTILLWSFTRDPSLRPQEEGRTSQYLGMLENPLVNPPDKLFGMFIGMGD